MKKGAMQSKKASPTSVTRGVARKLKPPSNASNTAPLTSAPNETSGVMELLDCRPRIPLQGRPKGQRTGPGA